jgi:hypothetical protein
MSLLTEQQLEDIMSNVHVCDEDWFESLLRKWNDRQSDFPEPKWQTAPKNAVVAQIREYWLDENDNVIEFNVLKQRVITKVEDGQ